LEHEDVAETVEPLRPGAGRTADRRLDELRAGPVVELPVADAGGTRGDGPAVARGVVEVGHAVGEEQAEVVTSFLVAIHSPFNRHIAHATLLMRMDTSETHLQVELEGELLVCTHGTRVRARPPRTSPRVAKR